MSRCKARQFSDQMICSECDLIWDTNDSAAPVCRPEVKAAIILPSPAANLPADMFIEKATEPPRPGKIVTYSDQQAFVVPPQTGGSHYSNLAIQPTTFAFTHDLDNATFSFIKYVTRHRNKNGRQDLKKASDFIVILGRAMENYPDKIRSPGLAAMVEYGQVNGLDRLDTGIMNVVVQALDCHVAGRSGAAQLKLALAATMLTNLSQSLYGIP